MTDYLEKESVFLTNLETRCRIVFFNPDGKAVEISSPQEYRHTLSTVLNGLLERRFRLLRFEEEKGTEFEATPGTWEHYVSCTSLWLYIISQKE